MHLRQLAQSAVAAIAFILSILISTRAAGQDTCASAILVPSPLPQDVVVDTSAYLDAGAISCTVSNGGVGGRDVWLRLPALTAGQTYRVKTYPGTVADTVIEIFRTTTGCGGLVSVGCNDDASGSVVTSELSFTALAGNTYYVKAESYYDEGGTFTIRVGPPPPALTNNTCATATNIASLPYNNEINVSTGTNTGDFDNNPTNGSSGIDAFWRFIPLLNGVYTVRGANNDPGGTMCLGYWSGACGTLVPLATPTLGIAPVVTQTLLAGQTYYIIYDDAFFGTPPLHVEIWLDGGPVAPVNDTCAAATILALNVPRTLDLSQANDEGRDLSIMTAIGASALPDAYFRFTPTATAVYRLRADEAGGSPVVGVFSGTCGTLVELDSVWTGGYNEPERADLNVRMNSGTTYYILTESFNPTTSITTVMNGPLPAVAAGDTCASPLFQTGTGSMTVNVDNMVNDIINSVTLVALGVPLDLGGRDAFIRFTPEFSVPHTFTVTGHADVNISLWSGSCGSLTEVAVADANFPTGGFDPATYTETETLTGINLTAGVPVYVVVDGLTWDDNGEFGAWTVTFDDGTVPNDTCDDPIELSVGVPITVNLSTAFDNSFDNPIKVQLGETGLKDLYYGFTAPADGVYTFRADEPGGDPAVSVLKQSCISPVFEGAAVAGTYDEPESAVASAFLFMGARVIVVLESGSPTSAITLEVEGPFTRPQGDLCADPLTQSGEGFLMINMANMTHQYVNSVTLNKTGAPVDFRGNDAIIEFTPQRTAPHTLSVTGRADVNIAAFSGLCGTLSEIAAADGHTPTGTFDPATYSETESITNLALTDGFAVFVVVDGLTWDDDTQYGNWTVVFDEVSPPNDECAGAVALVLATPATVALTQCHDEGRDGSTFTALGFTASWDAYYSFMPVSNGVYSFTNEEVGGKPGIAVFTGSCGSLTEVGATAAGRYDEFGSAVLNLRLVAGTGYTILSESDAPVGLAKTQVNGPLPAAPGDDCAGAIVQVGPGVQFVNVNNLTNNFVNSTTLGFPGVNVDLGGRDAFFEFTPQNTGQHEIIVEGSADLNISLLAAPCAADNRLASIDAFHPTIDGSFDPATYVERETISGVNLTQGVAVYVVVDGLSWDDNSQFGAWEVTFNDLTSVGAWENY